MTFSDFTNYIYKVNKWLDFANDKVLFLEERTNLLTTLAIEKNKICSHISSLRNSNKEFKSFLKKMKIELNNFHFLENGSNIKIFENTLATLQLEYSVLKILHSISTSQIVDGYFSISLKFSKRIYEINKTMIDIDKHLATLLLL